MNSLEPERILICLERPMSKRKGSLVKHHKSLSSEGERSFRNIFVAGGTI